jgi:hypothetical protein
MTPERYGDQAPSGNWDAPEGWRSVARGASLGPLPLQALVLPLVAEGSDFRRLAGSCVNERG